jgi:ABC-type multidrug transport system fused ATPase/permease subunit
MFQMRASRLTSFRADSWGSLWKCFDGKKNQLWLATFLSVFQALLIIPTLILIRYAFDTIIPDKNLFYLIITGLAIIFIRLMAMLINLWSRKLTVSMMTTVIFQIREELMLRMYRFSHAFYAHEDQRVLHSRIVQDSERTGQLINHLFSGLLPAVLISVGLMIILVWINWILFITILLLFPLIFLTNHRLAIKTRDKVREFQRSYESFSKVTSFVMKFMELIKTQSTEATETGKHRDILGNLRDKTGAMNLAFSFSGQVQAFLVSMAGILVIVLGGAAVMYGRMSLGEFFAFYLAASQLQNNISLINSSLTNVITGKESLSTVYEILCTNDPEPYYSGTGTESKKQINGDYEKIELVDITFGYEEELVLNELSLDIRRGQTLALVGANGAGKSTIVNLILGFYEPKSGCITIDGTAMNDIDLDSFRKTIGVVPQHPMLLPGTLRENILYGNQNANEASFSQALELSLTGRFIPNLPHGTETMVGEDGALLSGGERQMVAIARALLRRPALLILDEPTNHLSEDLVGELMNNIKAWEHRPAILLISHNHSVITYADAVYHIKGAHA